MNRITRNVEFIEYFFRGGRDKKKLGNLHIKGDKLFNYNTVLVEIDFDELVIYFNVTKYSCSTSRIQNLIRRELEYIKCDFEIIEIDDVEYDTQTLI